METAGKPNMVFYYVINEGSLRDSAKRGPAARLLAKIVGPKETKTAKVKGKKGQKDMAADEKELKEEMSKGGKVTGVVFKSFASPDGEINHNAQLCQQRAASSYDFVKKEFKRLDVNEINDANFVKQPDANEDWAGFKTLVERSNMKGKQDVLAVINSNASVDDKEKQLRSMTSVWNDLAKNILPRLRRTEVYLQGLGSVTVRSSAPRTAEELSSAHQQGADSTISQREMLILAASIKDINEREKIYKMYTDKYPNDWTGQNNYAAIILQEGGSMVNSDATAMKSNPKIDQALGMFDRLHTQYPTNDTITSNLAVAKRFSRKYEDAQTGYATAKTDGVKESNNMGILYIKYGFYDKAVTSFDAGQCDYNVALAYTLKGELDQALTKIDCITDKKSEDFYLKAIIGARKQDKTLMSTALTRAVQMDPSLRDRAKNDLEFMKYWTAPEFTNAIK